MGRWIRTTWLFAGALAFVSVIYAFAADGLIREANSGTYREHWRASYYVARLDGYRWFLPALCGGASVWALALMARHRVESVLWTTWRPGAAWKSIASAIAGIAVIAAAFHYSHREWLYYEMQCWDGYCDHAQLFARWLRGEADGSARLIEYATSDYHANSMLVPLLTGFASWLTDLSIVSSYRSLCALASLGTLVILYRSLLPGLGIASSARFPVVMLVASHLFWIRSFAYPQTDPFVMFFVTALLALALEQAAIRNPMRSCAIAGVLVAGLFTKLSFLPALAVVPGWRVLRLAISGKAFERSKVLALFQNLAIDAVLFVLLPLGLFLGYQYAAGSLGLYAHEFDRMATLDSSATYHLLCMIQLSAIPFALLSLRAHALSRRELLIAVWVGVYLGSLWYAQTSGWARFYLPVLPALMALAAPGLSRIAKLAGPVSLWSFVVIAALLNYAALELRLYY